MYRQNDTSDFGGQNYNLMRKNDDPSQLGVWKYEIYTGDTEWDDSFIDQITANTKFMNKSNKSADTYCQDEGFE